MDAQDEQLIELTKATARTEEKVDGLCKRFDSLMPHLVTMNERVDSLERSRSWVKGVGAVLGVLWTALLIVLGLHR